MVSLQLNRAHRICIPKTGRYTVKLTVTNAGGSNMITKQNYIVVVK